MRQLSSRDGLKRMRARARLVELDGPAVEPLVQALRDRHEQVRWEAAKALGALADPRAARRLVVALEDEDFDVRWVVAEALVAIRKPALQPLLEALIKRSHSALLREGAHHTLKGLHTQKNAPVIDRLLHALAEPDAEIAMRIAARDTLEEMRHAAARRERNLKH